METMQAIFSRKSVRNYTGEKISPETLDLILKAAQAAPVGSGKYENVYLTVIEDKEFLNAVEVATGELVANPDAHPFYGAPTLVVVSVKPKAEAGNVEFSNAAIIIHNMALAAVELGVGHCDIWGAIRALNGHTSLVKKLNLPEGFVPVSAIILGVSEEKYTERVIADRIGVNYLK